MTWYNNEQRHRGGEVKILKNRVKAYDKAKASKPARWCGEIRNWSPSGPVALSPIKEDAGTCRFQYNLSLKRLVKLIDQVLSNPFEPWVKTYKLAVCYVRTLTEP